MKTEQHTVVCQQWIESERGWGQRPDGYTLHLTVEDCRKFRDQFLKEQDAQHGAVGVPECYSAPRGEPVPITVAKETYEKLKQAQQKNGAFGMWGGDGSVAPPFRHKG